MENYLESELISLIGDESYIRLLETNGGVRTYIPKQPVGSRLEKEIGPIAAQALANEYGGEHIITPLSKHFQVKFHRENGKTIKWIALRLRISERHVLKICSEVC